MVSMHEELKKYERRRRMMLYAFIFVTAVVLSKLIVWIGSAH